ncbi:hypothetical protein Tco_0339367 [Tanacetum coccineum]
MGTFRETLAEGNEGALHLGPKRPRVYSDLSFENKERYNADIRATNILLQGLPKDIYTLINHYTDAKDIWDNNKGETIHDYYVRFAKLINDMWNIKMAMSRMQLNSKFVNNMLPEWGRFVTTMKLNRGLRDSNYDQLYAYLKQHEAHANENKIMLDRFAQHTVDPLALMSNVSHQQNQAIVQDGKVDVQNVQGRQNRVQGNNAQGAGATGYGGAQNKVRNATPGRQDNAVDEDVDEQPTMFMANLLSTDLVYDEAGPSYDSDILSEDNAVPVVQSNVYSIPNDAYMMILNDMHEQPTQYVFVTTQNNVFEKSLTAKLATYKEQVELYERRAKFELTEREQKIDEQLRIVITNYNIKEEIKEPHSVKL